MLLRRQNDHPTTKRSAVQFLAPSTVHVKVSLGKILNTQVLLVPSVWVNLMSRWHLVQYPQPLVCERNECWALQSKFVVFVNFCIPPSFSYTAVCGWHVKAYRQTPLSHALHKMTLSGRAKHSGSSRYPPPGPMPTVQVPWPTRVTRTATRTRALAGFRPVITAGCVYGNIGGVKCLWAIQQCHLVLTCNSTLGWKPVPFH